jgi:hypothetical protein
MSIPPLKYHEAFEAAPGRHFDRPAFGGAGS